MNNAKKLMVLLMAATVSMSMLAGCSSNKPAASSSTALAASTAGSSTAPAEPAKYPAKQLTITCPPAAGGGTDLLLRAMAPKIQEKLGVPVVVVNKPGAGCAIGYSAGAKEPADGSSITAAVAEMLSVPYVSEVDFTYKSFRPIANVNSCYGALTVSADAPYNTVEEFVAYCKENPGKVRFSNSGNGSNWHVLAAAFASAAEIDVIHVPFDGGGPAAVALAGGHVEACPVSPQEVQPHVASGKAKILCVFAPERLPELPDVPTAKELGYGDLILTIYRGFVAPEGTPDDVVAMIDEALQYALADPEVTAFMVQQNYMKDYLNADQFLELMAREDAIYDEQFKALGLSK